MHDSSSQHSNAIYLIQLQPVYLISECAPLSWRFCSKSTCLWLCCYALAREASMAFLRLFRVSFVMIWGAATVEMIGSSEFSSLLARALVHIVAFCGSPLKLEKLHPERGEILDAVAFTWIHSCMYVDTQMPCSPPFRQRHADFWGRVEWFEMWGLQSKTSVNIPPCTLRGGTALAETGLARWRLKIRVYCCC